MALPPSPPAPPVLGSAYRVVVTVLADGQLCMCSFDYSNTLGPINVPLDMAAFLGNWYTSCSGNLQACLPTSTTIQSVVAICLTDNSIANQFLTPNDPGSVAGNHLPLEMAAVNRRFSNFLKGKHSRGRYSMPAVPVSFTTPATSANNLNSAGLAAYALLNASVFGPFAGVSTLSQYTIMTRPPKGTPNYSRGVLVDENATDVLLGTVRRRKPGRGI